MDQSRDSHQLLEYAYETAIKAYQEHIRHYQTWVNLYAIFVGALFVGLYSLISMDNIKNLDWFLSLVSILGVTASICWLACVVGHYEWTKSWITIVKGFENKLFEGTYKIYGIVLKNGVEVKSMTERRFISTQKITQTFLFAVIMAWNAVIWIGIGYCCIKWIISILSMFSIFLIYFCSNKLYSSILNQKEELFSRAE